VQDAPAAVLAVVAAGVAAAVGGSGPTVIGSVLAAIVLTTALTGATLWLLGRRRFGQVVRYVPYPVVGGFMAGTGWVILTGGLDLLLGAEVRLLEPTTWSDPTMLLPLGLGIAFAVVLLIGDRRTSGSSFVPIACVVAIAAFTLIVSFGIGLDEARASGLLLGPFPDGSLWPPPALAGIDAAAVAEQLPAILTVVVISVVALVLTAGGVELNSHEDVDLDRELRVAGIGNLLAAPGGGFPGFPGLALTTLVQRTGLDGRATRAVAAGVVLATLVFSGAIVSLVPSWVVGGLLAFLGLRFLVEWLVDGWSRLRRGDYAVVALIVIVIAAVGLLAGVVVGIAATAVQFVLTYSRSEVVRHELDATAFASTVDRAPHEQAALAEQAGRIRILELQGFVFFGTAARVLDRVRGYMDADGGPADGGPPDYLVIDLARIVGLDASAVLTFTRVIELARRNDAVVVLTGPRPAVVDALERGGITADGQVRIEASLDRGVQACEDELLAAAGIVGGDVPDLRAHLSAELGDASLADRLLARLERREVAAGDIVLARGERSRELYLLEVGRVTVSTVGRDGVRRRLRTMLPGTVIGEVAAYLDVPRSADVIAEDDVVVQRLPDASWDRLAQEDPELAAALHGWLASQLATRLTATLRTLQALSG
ncbi:MAG: SulP family inorganic anion transporter, partial [Actinomycetota bacterium]